MGNYSGSNSFLDCIARTRHGQGKPGLAIQWGAWGEVGMAATMTDSMRARTMNGPMPYFTNKQGVEGMEAGLRTGLPYFSVFIYNPPVMFGMSQGEDSIMQCYSRNFYSEVCRLILSRALTDNTCTQPSGQPRVVLTEAYPKKIGCVTTHSLCRPNRSRMRNGVTISANGRDALNCCWWTPLCIVTFGH